MPSGRPTGFQHGLLIASPPRPILDAFFTPAALSVWWQTVRAITTPRTLGVYAVEWDPTPFRDEVLGPLGGVFHGTVLEHRSDAGFFLADCYWLPPEGEPVGPMALEVTCAPEDDATRLTVAQTGHDRSFRWERYYTVIGPGWRNSLRALKQYVEQGPEAVLAERALGREIRPLDPSPRS